MFTTLRFEHRWLQQDKVECVVYNGDRHVATVIVDLNEDSVTIVDGDFSSIPENLSLQRKLRKNHTELYLDAINKSVRNWIQKQH
ncbi:hypothetical protein [Alicyclobacillus macrosporangiidus]|uniref:hypothetical protein n=1 Tax=Alicyclobacillus macrosporangiidus TaxID=392015 RepID=UPI0012DC508B|nr:hypothetical protein [Alicyclobacillus macrosporangiidus]